MVRSARLQRYIPANSTACGANCCANTLILCGVDHQEGSARGFGFCLNGHHERWAFVAVAAAVVVVVVFRLDGAGGAREGEDEETVGLDVIAVVAGEGEEEDSEGGEDEG